MGFNSAFKGLIQANIFLTMKDSCVHYNVLFCLNQETKKDDFSNGN